MASGGGELLHLLFVLAYSVRNYRHSARTPTEHCGRQAHVGLIRARVRHEQPDRHFAHNGLGGWDGDSVFQELPSCARGPCVISPICVGLV